jgi:hypothetical protein
LNIKDVRKRMRDLMELIGYKAEETELKDNLKKMFGEIDTIRKEMHDFAQRNKSNSNMSADNLILQMTNRVILILKLFLDKKS